MTTIRRSLIFALMLAAALVVAACDDAVDTDDVLDDDEDTTTETEDEDDADTDEAVTEEPEADDAEADDAATEETDDAETDDSTTTPETEDSADDESATEESDSDDEATTPESDDGDAEEQGADEILESAAERAEELETAKFEIDGNGVLEVEELGEVTLSEAEGVVERPDRAQVDVEVDADAADIPLTIVSTEDGVYFTDVFTGDWQEAPDEFQFNPAIIFDNDQGIPALIRSVEDAEVLGTEEIDGSETYQIYGVIDQELMEQGTGGIFQAEEDVDFNVWVDQETSDVRQVRAEDPTDESDSVWEMRIFEHDEPVEIDDPEGDD